MYYIADKIHLQVKWLSVMHRSAVCCLTTRPQNYHQFLIFNLGLPKSSICIHYIIQTNNSCANSHGRLAPDVH